MKRLFSVSLVAFVAAGALMSPANAQYGGGRGAGSINATQNRLRARIDAGVASGRLNSKEAARLRAKMAQINTLEARMRDNVPGRGRSGLNPAERNRLSSELALLNSQITRELNDFDHRRANYWKSNKRWH